MDDEKKTSAYKSIQDAVFNGGAALGAGASTRYLQGIQNEIDDLTKSIIQAGQDNIGKRSNILGGDLAEFWHAGTFNINSSLQDKINKNYADIPRVNTLGSSDITTSSGQTNQLKYYRDFIGSANKQRTSYLGHYKQMHSDMSGFQQWFEKNAPQGSTPESVIYPRDMVKIIPKDQLQDAENYLQKKVLKYQAKGQLEEAKSTQDVLGKLTDRMHENGVESTPLSKEDSTKLASDAKNNKFDPKDYGLDEASEIASHQNLVLKQALKTGVSAAAVSAVLTMLPEFLKSVQQLANREGIDLSDLSQSTGPIVANSVDAFFQATITDYLVTDMTSGALGKMFSKLTPMSISTIVIFVYGSCKTYIHYARGKISAVDAKKEVNSLLFSSVFTYLGGALGLLVSPFCMTLGSIIGSTVGGFVFNGANELVMSYALRNNTTVFGLVDQDYQLTDTMAQKMGLETIEIDNFDLPSFELDDFSLDDFSMEPFDFDHIDVGLIRRGVIGINKIGYVEN